MKREMRRMMPSIPIEVDCNESDMSMINDVMMRDEIRVELSRQKVQVLDVPGRSTEIVCLSTRPLSNGSE
jgi:hypothetical protein